jgi:hypothetical protein
MIWLAAAAMLLVARDPAMICALLHITNAVLELQAERAKGCYAGSKNPIRYETHSGMTEMRHNGPSKARHKVQCTLA